MSLVICPDCDTKVSDAAVACPKCGRPRLKEDWKADRSKLWGCLGGIVLLLFVIYGIKSCGSWVGNLPTYVDKTTQVASEQANIPAGQARYYKFEVTPQMRDAVLKGKFSAVGGTGNDIMAFVADEEDYINWNNEHDYKVFWQTDGHQTVGSFTVKLAKGVYYLVLTNRFSAVSDKQVTIDATLSFTEEQKNK